MPKERVITHPWVIDEVSPPPPIWAEVVGQLQGFGPSRRDAIARSFHPHLITTGHGTFSGPEGTVRVGPGDMFCLWPGREHHFWEDPDDPWHFYWLRLSGAQTEPIIRGLGLAGDNRVGRPVDPPAAIRAWQKLFDYYAAGEPRDPYRAQALLYELLASLRQQAPAERFDPDRRLVGEARAILEDLLSTGINVSELAERLGVTRQRLFDAFRDQLDQTPTEYIQRIRLERARQLLEDTDLKVSAVARACGYGNEKYFYRRFRELTGRTPGQHRRRG
jgi:AraC-like DNA-binding protein